MQALCRLLAVVGAVVTTSRAQPAMAPQFRSFTDTACSSLIEKKLDDLRDTALKQAEMVCAALPDARQPACLQLAKVQVRSTDGQDRAAWKARCMQSVQSFLGAKVAFPGVRAAVGDFDLKQGWQMRAAAQEHFNAAIGQIQMEQHLVSETAPQARLYDSVPPQEVAAGRRARQGPAPLFAVLSLSAATLLVSGAVVGLRRLAKGSDQSRCVEEGAADEIIE